MLLQLHVWALYLLQEGGAIGWDPRSLWAQMGALAKIVVIRLFIMSAYSIGVMIDRLMAYSAARKQSRAFAPAVAGALREGKLDEAVKIADRYKKSHLAKVVVAGLAGIPGAPDQLRDPRRRNRSFQARFGTRRSHRSRRTEARRQRPGDHRFDGPLRGTVRNGRRHHQRVQAGFPTRSPPVWARWPAVFRKPW